MQWIADRFFKSGERWIDAASGQDVWVLVTAAGGGDGIDWSDRCARLSALRHPLLNPLLDFGLAGPHHRFEAYARAGALPMDGESGLGLLEHAIRFLRANGVRLDPPRGQIAMRAVSAGRHRLRRPIGLTLQPRRALTSLEASLDCGRAVGPVAVHVSGAERSGLRTFCVLAARLARLRGFVPVAAATVERFPSVRAYLRERHVCLFDDGADGRASSSTVAAVISELASASSRRHVVIRVQRGRGPAARGVVLEPMGVRSLVGMVFADPAEGPDEEELFRAARAADGRPGAFVHALAGDHASGGAMVVHEAPAQYGVEPSGEDGVQHGRVLGSALRAAPRAATLARAGRHAAAARVLHRGLRVLAGRQRNAEAAACALQLGWLALERGDVTAARSTFARGRALAAGHPSSVLCAAAEGTALVDAADLLEGEAVLRGAVAAAETLSDAHIVTAAAALARCLYWQERFTEAVAVAAAYRHAPGEAGERSRLLAVMARAQVQLDRVSAAVATAREAQSLAAEASDGSVAATAELALAEALRTAGDADGSDAAVTRAVALARRAHLPLVRVRAAILRLQHRERREAGRLARALRRMTLPPLLARRLETALERRPSPPRSIEAVVELESLLDISQRSADDRAALSGICRAVAERLRTSSVAVFSRDDRTLALDGRPFGAMTSVVRETLACGQRVPPDRGTEPREAVEAVRYGGEVIAAIACRWTAGSPVDAEGAGLVLRAAALSAAGPVRGLLDQALPEPPAAWGDLIGESAAAAALREAVARAARAPFPVLIEGESGSGKELVARAIHRLGPRRDRRFCALNCAALTDDLVEAELFGHARGAFTGAATERAGLFEEADGGTLFLDEVGELSARAQAKLLRVLQEGEVRRVGENLPRRVDVRVVAATNRRLESEVAAGRFRADLRFRLDVVRIAVPPLRERIGDVALLAAHFWRDASARVGSHATLSPDALAALARYDWPGNVRELQNVIAWMAVHSPRRGRVGASAVPCRVAQASPPLASTLEAAREDFERRFVRAALAGANGQRARAADALGISRQGLAKMIRRLQIDAP